MANKYWVDGTGNWDLTDKTHWSDTSGGAGGASVPSAGDNAYFNASSGGGTATVTNSYVDVARLNTTGYTGTLACNTDCYINVSANTTSVTLGTGATHTTLNLHIDSTGAMTSNGKSIGTLKVFEGTLTFSDALSCTLLFKDGYSSTNPAYLVLPASATSTIGALSLLGKISLYSAVSGTRATVSDGAGTNTFIDTVIKDIAFTGGATWLADVTCTDGGNNTGITFAPKPGGLFFGSHF